MKKCVGILLILALCLTFVAFSGPKETKLKDNNGNIVGSLKETKENGSVKKIEIFDNDGKLIREIVPETEDGYLRVGDTYGSVALQSIANTYINKGYARDTVCIAISEWSSNRKCMISDEIILLNPIGQTMERYWFNLKDGSYNIIKMETYLPNGEPFFHYEASVTGGWFVFGSIGGVGNSAYFVQEFDAQGKEIVQKEIDTDTGEIIDPGVPQE